MRLKINTNLATTTALTFNNLVKKPDYNTKIAEIENKTTIDHDHDKYVTTQEFTILLIMIMINMLLLKNLLYY